MIKKVVIDLEFLMEHGLTPTSYTWLYLMYHNDDRALVEFKLGKLLSENLIKRAFITETFALTSKATDLFEDNSFERKFLELWELFPREVPDGKGGSRILRASSSEGKQAEVCREKYSRILHNKPDLHKHIIKCLKLQLEKEAQRIQFMNGIEVWLNQHIWEKYEDLEVNNTDYTETI